MKRGIWHALTGEVLGWKGGGSGFDMPSEW